MGMWYIKMGVYLQWINVIKIRFLFNSLNIPLSIKGFLHRLWFLVRENGFVIGLQYEKDKKKHVEIWNATCFFLSKIDF